MPVDKLVNDAIRHLAKAGLIGQASLLANYQNRDALQLARSGAQDRLRWMGGVLRDEAALAIRAIDLALVAL